MSKHRDPALLISIFVCIAFSFILVFKTGDSIWRDVIAAGFLLLAVLLAVPMNGAKAIEPLRGLIRSVRGRDSVTINKVDE